jgi:tetratricopeptide (TPR) repeat protein
MVSIIVIENGGSSEALKENVKRAMDIQGTETFLVANAPLPEVWQTRNYIALSHSSPSSCLQNAINRARGDEILFIDSKASPSSKQLSQMIAAMNANSSAAFINCNVRAGNEIIEMPDLSNSNLVAALTSNSLWPLLMVGTTKKMLQSMGEMNGSSIAEILARMMIRASAQGDEILSAPITLDISADLASSLAMSNESASRSLNTAVNSCNIEELFPAHPWASHEEESAAASYHTLAAHFMRLGDSDSALACLSFSDQFEDSPRSLALKGLIAQTRGELLGAVANMVSSLQQYESRKNDGHNNHYLSFKPNNLEMVNSKLHAGLEALNLRDNESALGYFAEAVFDFDPFYAELGVTASKTH